MLNRSQPTVTRIESGSRSPSQDELQDMIRIYDPAQPLRDRLDGYATLPDRPTESSVSPNPYFVEMQRAVETADTILTLHSERTPMHLQSEQYSLLQYQKADSGVAETDVLRSREQRCRIFTREHPPRYRALLSESSLLRAPGGSPVVVQQQGRYLLDQLDRYPHFSLQILHFQADLAYVDADFTLHKMPPGTADMVYVPYGLDGRLIKERNGVLEREQYWHKAQRAALSEDESKKYLHELAQHGRRIS